MKTFLLVLLAVLVAVGVFIYTDPQLRRDVSNMFHGFIGTTTGVDTRSTTVYKWRNKQGELQYTQEPPPEGTAFEKVEARSDVNVLPLPDKLRED